MLGNGLLPPRAASGCASGGSSSPRSTGSASLAYGEVMTAYTARRLADWKDGDVLDVHAEMMALTQAIVAKTLFDADVSGREPTPSPRR